jgi:predicted PurR-regulated permease PerM
MNTKKIIQLIILTVFCLWLALNYTVALDLVGYIIGLFMPLLIGACIAFILNVPMKFIENRLLGKLDGRIGKTGRGISAWKRAKRIISLLLTLIVVLGIITFVLAMIIPTLRETITFIIARAPKFFVALEGNVKDILSGLGISGEFSDIFKNNWADIPERIITFVSGTGSALASGAAHVAEGVFSTLANALFGFVFAFYILLTKETLSRQVKRLMDAYLSKRKGAFIKRTAKLSMRIFEKFVSGQCIEAVIIGTLTAIGSIAINSHYAVMLGVLVGFTALIPIIGAIIGVVIGALLLIMVSPFQALAFIIFIIVLQQLENHIIYPRVVGKSIGLPGMWVLLAVLVGGSLYGILGIIIGVPLTSVIYSMLRGDSRHRVKIKHRAVEKAHKTEELAKE